MGEGEVEGVAYITNTATQTIIAMVGHIDADGIGNGVEHSASIGTQPFKMNRNGGNVGATIVDYLEGDGVILNVDSTRGTGRYNFGDRDITLQWRIDRYANLRVVAGTATTADSAEVVAGVMEVLGSGVPVGRTDVVVVSVVEESARHGIVSVPTYHTAFTLCGPEVTIRTVVDGSIGRDRHIRCVIRSEADVGGGIVKGLYIIFMCDPATQTNGDVLQITRRIEVGATFRCYDSVAGDADRQR